MAEESRTHLAVRDDADDHLTQPALLTRSLSPWSLMEDDNLGSSFGPAHSFDITGSLSNKELRENGIDRVASPSTLFNESILRADQVMPKRNQAVSLASMLQLRKSSEIIDYTAGFDT